MAATSTNQRILEQPDVIAGYLRAITDEFSVDAQMSSDDLDAIKRYDDEKRAGLLVPLVDLESQA